MKLTDLQSALKDIKLPVSYDPESQNIYDAVDNHILDIRGYGRLKSEIRMDCIGYFVAECINKCPKNLLNDNLTIKS